LVFERFYVLGRDADTLDHVPDDELPYCLHHP
jgi:hypothetical protein